MRDRTLFDLHCDLVMTKLGPGHFLPRKMSNALGLMVRMLFAHQPPATLTVPSADPTEAYFNACLTSPLFGNVLPALHRLPGTIHSTNNQKHLLSFWVGDPQELRRSPWTKIFEPGLWWWAFTIFRPLR